MLYKKDSYDLEIIKNQNLTCITLNISHLYNEVNIFIHLSAYFIVEVILDINQ